MRGSFILPVDHPPAAEELDGLRDLVEIVRARCSTGSQDLTSEARLRPKDEQSDAVPSRPSSDLFVE